jgi:hypothetical protein
MKTAVEWLVEEFKETILKEYGEGRFNYLINQAKEMEKQQIIDAWNSASGGDSFYEGQDYYNETFKTDKG